ncbi:MAG: tetratricopeptide repeat protein [bacterium]|nr:tetratricopeptide repeat protein [bacterium]
MVENYFEKGEKYRETYEAHGRNLLAINNAIENYKKGLKLDPNNILYHYRLSYSYHLMRRLMEASSEYEIVLKLDPPQMATEENLKLVEKYTPRLYANPKEFFKLKDLVVVIHPEKPIIAYNLFWEDDIDYPGDNDPSDHEVVWIEFSQSKGEVTGVYTYFHQAILSTEEAVKDANLHNQRARINAEWGGHGSLPLSWEKLHLEVIFEKIGKRIKIKDMAQRYQELSKSIKNPNHPLARDWPKNFSGSYKDFINFSKYIELRRFLKKKKMVIISQWPNAVINQHFLNYNYFPKKQWPK